MVAFESKAFSFLFAAAVANFLISVVLAVPPTYNFPSRSFAEHFTLFATHCSYSLILPSLLVMFYFGEEPGKWTLRVTTLVGAVLFMLSGSLCAYEGVLHFDQCNIFQIAVIILLFVVGFILEFMFLGGLFKMI